MTNPHNNVELEAAKFLHKLIQESTDEPTKLATKLYVILQHMRSSGKENSMPYQVISRAMETVINQHNLDTEALMSSRLPLAGGTPVGDPLSPQLEGSAQRLGITIDSKPSLGVNEIAKFDAQASLSSFAGPSNIGHGAANKMHGATPSSSSMYPVMESGISSPTQFGSSSYENYGSVAKVHKDRSMEAFSFMSSGDLSSSRKVFEHEGGHPNAFKNAYKVLHVKNTLSSVPNNALESSMLRNANPRDAGKSAMAQVLMPSMPFKEQHLKQLRAQCLVFLAFRNGMMPKRLHLEIALGNFFPKEDGSCKEPNDPRGKDQSADDQSKIPDVTMGFGRLDNMRDAGIISSRLSTRALADANSSKEAEKSSMTEGKNDQPIGVAEHADEKRTSSLTRRKPEAEIHTHEPSELQASSSGGPQSDLNIRGIPPSNHEGDIVKSLGQMARQSSSVGSLGKQMNLDMISWTETNCPSETSKVLPTSSAVPYESVPETIDNNLSHSQTLEGHVQGNQHDEGQLPLKEQWKPASGMDIQHYTVMPGKDPNVVSKNFSQGETDQEEEDFSTSTDMPPSPKYTMSEKWVLDQQKKKFLVEQNWLAKQRKTEQRIAACSRKFKENVRSSEDISAKTKSVIELKKLQLLELQRRLRSDILNDFFKPIASEMDRLKSQKKHRIGRRSKQLERYEQKMKEERQKRIRESQKEFFSDIEVHRERLEDVFKMKRERWKGFNKYFREFHKRKERIHREKIDRIQREKINLLKINDVEGYLRMVQDAKSDRVKQLLKETEKYLQKLGAKLQDAKAMPKQFENDMDENHIASIVENNEFSIENEDEADQAKHYLESNEKYYLMAHSIKENVAEQPTCLVGGKLREYQMNGLRWLVSLYNNHLNGILADEMGLGKTVQVISLICYLMETKNDRGPFLVVVPSSVLPGWESEINFWAPSIHRIVYSGPPEERRRLFKEHIVHQKFNVLLTTYEYLMNKHDRPKLSKLHWHYLIIDEGHRIKNASCKLNADLKHYHSNHRLLLTGTPLQNNLEELWALLNFLLPNIFNSSEDFSQWFNKPFESNGDNSPDEVLLSEEENLLIINRLHQVLRPFVLRRLKHKVENELPEKIERLVRCEASAYQKLLMKRVEENLGAIGASKARSVHNSVMELRNICNHPYLSQLHVEEVHDLIPNHYLPKIVRLCGKLEMLDRLLPKLKATDHRVLLFSTMTRLLDVLEDYLFWKQYKYLRLDGHTSGGDRGALIDLFNQPDSPFFIFLLSIRAGGVGVNLQAADTVIIFDTDWNPQVDLQAQARAHRIGQKKDVLVIRLETVQTVEEQVRAAAEHKLGVANQSITAGFFDNNTSAEDRREYLESLLRECKKEEVAHVLDDDSLNDLIARSESEIDIFESVDKQRHEEEMAAWKELVSGQRARGAEPVPPLPSRLVTDEDLKPFYEAMKISEVSNSVVVSNAKRKSEYLGGLDTQQYGRGKRLREIRSYEEQWTEEEFEKMCQADSPDSPKLKEELGEKKLPTSTNETAMVVDATSTNETAMVVDASDAPVHPKLPIQVVQPSLELPAQQTKEVTPPSKRGRGRPKRVTVETSPSPLVLQAPSAVVKMDMRSQTGAVSSSAMVTGQDSLPSSTNIKSISGTIQQFGVYIAPTSQPAPTCPHIDTVVHSTTTHMPVQGRGRGRKTQSGSDAPRRRGKRQTTVPSVVPLVTAPSITGKVDAGTLGGPDSISGSNPVQSISTVVSVAPPSSGTVMDIGSQGHPSSSSIIPGSEIMVGISGTAHDLAIGTIPSSQQISPLPSASVSIQSILPPDTAAPKQGRGRGRRAQSEVRAQRGRGRKRGLVEPGAPSDVTNLSPNVNEPPGKKSRASTLVTSPGVNKTPVLDHADGKFMEKPMDHQSIKVVPAQVSIRETSLEEQSVSALSVTEAADQLIDRTIGTPGDKLEKEDDKQLSKGSVPHETIPTKPDLCQSKTEEKQCSILLSLEMEASVSAPTLDPSIDKLKHHQPRREDESKQLNNPPILHETLLTKSEFAASESAVERSLSAFQTLDVQAPSLVLEKGKSIDAPDATNMPALHVKAPTSVLEKVESVDTPETAYIKQQREIHFSDDTLGLEPDVTEHEISKNLHSSLSCTETVALVVEPALDLKVNKYCVGSANGREKKTLPDEVLVPKSESAVSDNSAGQSSSALSASEGTSFLPDFQACMSEGKSDKKYAKEQQVKAYLVVPASETTLELSMDVSNNLHSRKENINENVNKKTAVEEVLSKTELTADETSVKKSLSAFSVSEEETSPSSSRYKAKDKSEVSNVKQESGGPSPEATAFLKRDVADNEISREVAYSSLSTSVIATTDVEPALDLTMDNVKDNQHWDEDVKRQENNGNIANAVLNLKSELNNCGSLEEGSSPGLSVMEAEASSLNLQIEICKDKTEQDKAPFPEDVPVLNYHGIENENLERTTPLIGSHLKVTTPITEPIMHLEMDNREHHQRGNKDANKLENESLPCKDGDEPIGDLAWDKSKDHNPVKEDAGELEKNAVVEQSISLTLPTLKMETLVVGSTSDAIGQEIYETVHNKVCVSVSEASEDLENEMVEKNISSTVPHLEMETPIGTTSNEVRQEIEIFQDEVCVSESVYEVEKNKLPDILPSEMEARVAGSTSGAIGHEICERVQNEFCASEAAHDVENEVMETNLPSAMPPLEMDSSVARSTSNAIGQETYVSIGNEACTSEVIHMENKVVDRNILTSMLPPEINAPSGSISVFGKETCETILNEVPSSVSEATHDVVNVWKSEVSQDEAYVSASDTNHDKAHVSQSETIQNEFHATQSEATQDEDHAIKSEATQEEASVSLCEPTINGSLGKRPSLSNLEVFSSSLDLLIDESEKKEEARTQPESMGAHVDDAPSGSQISETDILKKLSSNLSSKGPIAPGFEPVSGEAGQGPVAPAFEKNKEEVGKQPESMGANVENTSSGSHISLSLNLSSTGLVVPAFEPVSGDAGQGPVAPAFERKNLSSTGLVVPVFEPVSGDAGQGPVAPAFERNEEEVGKQPEIVGAHVEGTPLGSRISENAILKEKLSSNLSSTGPVAPVFEPVSGDDGQGPVAPAFDKNEEVGTQSERKGAHVEDVPSGSHISESDIAKEELSLNLSSLGPVVPAFEPASGDTGQGPVAPSFERNEEEVGKQPEMVRAHVEDAPSGYCISENAILKEKLSSNLSSTGQLASVFEPVSGMAGEGLIALSFERNEEEVWKQPESMEAHVDDAPSGSHISETDILKEKLSSNLSSTGQVAPSFGPVSGMAGQGPVAPAFERNEEEVLKQKESMGVHVEDAPSGSHVSETDISNEKLLTPAFEPVSG